LHRRPAAARPGCDRRPARQPAGDDPAGLRAGAPGRALARHRALALRARRAALMAAESKAGAEGGAGVSSADYGRMASFFAVGVGLTGVITYVYFFIASHVLSKPE